MKRKAVYALLTYGDGGVPEWGTKFTEIESRGMNVGLELARLFMEQSVEQQADRVRRSRRRNCR
jgi:hypothetical protein